MRTSPRRKDHQLPKPRVVALLPSLIASCQIGVIKPLKALEKKGLIELRYYLESKASTTAVDWADVVVFCRNTEPRYAHLLNEAVSLHKPIIFDIDDNFWDVPFETDPELARYHRLPLRIQQFERYITHASLVRAYSPTLKTLVTKLNPRVKLLKSGFDFSLIGPPPTKSKNGKVKIVYATSRVVDDQYHLFREGLQRVLDTYAGRVEATIWGCHPPEFAGQRNVKLLPLVSSYDGFLREFSQQGFDIGLAPLVDSHFNSSKNNTKYRDYGACRVAGVYSDVVVYSCVENEKTGILVANNPESWFEGISKLVMDVDLRERIRQSAYDTVYREYRQELVEDEWLSEITELLAGSTGYALVARAQRRQKLVRIRADFPGLCGICVPAFSPEENEKLSKLLVELQSVDRGVLRQATGISQFEREEDRELVFAFSPIWNSQEQEFLLKFVAADDSDVSQTTPWLPTNAYVRMLYAKDGSARCS